MENKMIILAGPQKIAGSVRNRLASFQNLEVETLSSIMKRNENGVLPIFCWENIRIYDAYERQVNRVLGFRIINEPTPYWWMDGELGGTLGKHQNSFNLWSNNADDPLVLALGSYLMERQMQIPGGMPTGVVYQQPPRLENIIRSLLKAWTGGQQFLNNYLSGKLDLDELGQWRKSLQPQVRFVFDTFEKLLHIDLPRGNTGGNVNSISNMLEILDTQKDRIPAVSLDIPPLVRRQH